MNPPTTTPHANPPSTTASAAADGALARAVRDAVTGIQRSAAAQVEGWRASESAFESAMARLKARFEDAQRAASTAHDQERAAADEALAQATAEIDATLGAERTRVQQTRARETADLQERGRRELSRAAKARDDAVWLAESVYDTKKGRPGQEFEALKRELDEHLNASEQARTLANDFLARCRCPRVPAAEDSTSPRAGESSPESAGALAGEAAARVRELAAEVPAALARVRGLVLARLMQEILPALIVLAFAGAGAAVAMFALGERSVGVIAGAGGGGAALGVLALWAVHRRAKAQARARGAALGAVLNNLRRAHEEAITLASQHRQASEYALREARDRETAAARAAYADLDAKVRAVAGQQLAAIKSRYGQQEGDLIAREKHARSTAQRDHDLRHGAALQAHTTAQADAARAYEAAATDAHRAREQARREVVQAWHAGMEFALARAGEAAGALAGQPPAFPAPADLRLPAEPAPGVRVGQVRLDLRSVPGALPDDEGLRIAHAPEVLDLPIALELPARGSLLVEYTPAPPEARAQALSLLNAVILRLFSTHPPGKVRFTLVDPVGLGQSFAGLMHLADYFPWLVSERIWTEPKHIEQRLIDLTEHMETVIQKYLRNQFSDIAQYNQQAGEVAEPYRFLVLADFPAGLSEQAAARLASIVASGPRCGVYTLIAANVREKMPAGGLSLKDLERAALTIAHRQGRFQLLDQDLGPLPLAIDQAPADDAFNALVHRAGEQSKDSGRVQVPFDVVAPAPAQRWTASASLDVRAPLGRAGALKIQHMALGRGTAQHALIAGRTGSGKSTLLHVIITSVAMWYSPDEVQLYLVDFKKGVEFKPYAEHALPHARVIAIESEREFGLSVLRRLDEELQRRGEMFRAAGAQDLAGFRKAATGGTGVPPVSSAEPSHPTLPRLLLLIDEFQELFAEDDKIAGEAALLLDRLVRQGRAFGMHVVLGSQTLAGSYSLPRSTIGQMGVRIALQCSEADSYLILSDDNPAARLLSRPGEAIYNDASGLIEGNSPFQVAWLGDERREQILQDLARDAGARPSAAALPPPIVFEGSRPAQLERSHEIADALAHPPAQPPAVPRAWLGDAVAIKDATHATFPRHSSANLLIVGQRDEAAVGMMAGALASLAGQHANVPGRADRARGARVLLLDGTPADARLFGALPNVAQRVGAEIIDYRAAAALVGEVAAEVRRREEVASGADAASSSAPPIFLCIHALHRFRQFRKQDEDWGASFSSGGDDAGAPAARPDRDLALVLEKGPPVGVHVLTWCDTLQNLERTLSRASIREFDARVLMQVSSSDSSALMDSPLAASLGAYRAVLFSESTGVAERFRPFAPPAPGWLSG